MPCAQFKSTPWVPNNSRYLGLASPGDATKGGEKRRGEREKNRQVNKKIRNKYLCEEREARARAFLPYVKRYRVRAGRNGLPKSRREYRISLPYLIVLFRAPISRGTNLQLVVRGVIYTYIAEVGTTHCAKLPKTTFLGGSAL